MFQLTVLQIFVSSMGHSRGGALYWTLTSELARFHCRNFEFILWGLSPLLGHLQEPLWGLTRVGTKIGPEKLLDRLNLEPSRRGALA